MELFDQVAVEEKELVGIDLYHGHCTKALGLFQLLRNTGTKNGVKLVELQMIYMTSMSSPYSRCRCMLDNRKGKSLIHLGKYITMIK